MDVLELRSHILFKMRKFDEALADAQKMVKLKPESARGYLRAGKVFRARNIQEAALKVYKLAHKKVAKGDPEYHVVEKYFNELSKDLGLPTNAKRRKETLIPEPTQPASATDPQRPPEPVLQPLVVQTTIADLPNELLGSVLSYLKVPQLFHLSAVNRRFATVLRGASELWRNLDFTRQATIITDRGLLTALRNGGSNVRNLRLDGCSNITDAAVRQLPKLAPRIVELALTSNGRVQQHIITAALTGLKDLAVLRMDSTRLRDHGVQAVLGPATKLRSLTARNCELTAEAFEADAAAQPVKSMTSLALAECALIDNRAVSAIARRLPNLQELELRACNLLTSACLQSIAALEHLRYLALPAFDRARGNGMDAGLGEIVATCGASLRYVGLGGSIALTDAGVAMLASSCPNLQGIDLSKCPHVTDASMLSLRSSCAKLKKLDVRGCNRLTDVGLCGLFEGCKFIETLYLSGIQSLTSEPLKLLARKAKYLRELHVANCPNVTGSGILAVSEGVASSRLQILNMDGCGRLTVDEVLLARRRLPKARVSASFV
ncbi:hypothetical protein HK101_008192 [Irineochytrium annulatum]|nr:hypothetical protein HK101_008192 [Irineochytrium annulatum]